MKTKLLMTASAGYYILLGTLLTFMPRELNELLGMSANVGDTLMSQTLGAAFLALGWINWMTKSNILGEIYGKPITLANFLFFFVTSMAYLKSGDNILLWTLTGICSGFTIWFGYVTFTHPFKK